MCFGFCFFSLSLSCLFPARLHFSQWQDLIRFANMPLVLLKDAAASLYEFVGIGHMVDEPRAQEKEDNTRCLNGGKKLRWRGLTLLMPGL